MIFLHPVFLEGVLEAVEKLNAEGNGDTKGKKVNFLQIKYMLPFLTEGVKQILTQAQKLVLVENNYSAQLGHLISEQTGVQIEDKILRSNGATFTVDEIYDELNKRLR